MNLRKLSVLLTAIAPLLFAGQASASLIGDTVNASLIQAGATIAPGAAVVGPGVEFVVDLSGSSLLFIDIDDSSIAFTSQQSFPFGTDIFTFSDLDWVGSPGQIVGFSLSVDAGISGLDSTDITFTDDSVTVSFEGGVNFSASNLTAIINLDVVHVPEPSTALLFATGLGLMAGRRGRR